MKRFLLLFAGLLLLAGCQLARPRYLRDEDLMWRNTARVKHQTARVERRARHYLRLERRARPQ